MFTATQAHDRRATIPVVCVTETFSALIALRAMTVLSGTTGHVLNSPRLILKCYNDLVSSGFVPNVTVLTVTRSSFPASLKTSILPSMIWMVVYRP